VLQHPNNRRVAEYVGATNFLRGTVWSTANAALLSSGAVVCWRISGPLPRRALSTNAASGLRMSGGLARAGRRQAKHLVRRDYLRGRAWNRLPAEVRPPGGRGSRGSSWSTAPRMWHFLMKLHPESRCGQPCPRTICTCSPQRTEPDEAIDRNAGAFPCDGKSVFSLCKIDKDLTTAEQTRIQFVLLRFLNPVNTCAGIPWEGHCLPFIVFPAQANWESRHTRIRYSEGNWRAQRWSQRLHASMRQDPRAQAVTSPTGS